MSFFEPLPSQFHFTDEPDHESVVRLLIVSGRSGSGKSSVLNVLEDLGYYCIDNLPLMLLPDVSEKLICTNQVYKLALGVDVRTPQSDLSQFNAVYQALKQLGQQQLQALGLRLQPEVVYLTTDETVLVARFANRRRHPLLKERQFIEQSLLQMTTDTTTANTVKDESAHRQSINIANNNFDNNLDKIQSKQEKSDTVTQHNYKPQSNVLRLFEALELETRLLSPIATYATIKIDTTHLNIHQLKARVVEHLGIYHQTTVTLLSFGFKYGMPIDADFVFDVRILPNPHWIEGLKAQTGQDMAVRKFFAKHESVQQMQQHIGSFLTHWLPEFLQNNRHSVTVAIGCTGGKHRSVYLTEQLTQQLTNVLPDTMQVNALHREQQRWHSS